MSRLIKIILAAFVLAGGFGCLAQGPSSFDGGNAGGSLSSSPSAAADKPPVDTAAETPAGFLGSNTESSDLGECDYDPTLAKCQFKDAAPASRSAMCVLGYDVVRFVYDFIAPGTMVAQTCFFTGQEDGTEYLTELSKIDSSDTVAGWRYYDTCVRLDADGKAPDNYTIPTGAPAVVGYRGFYFKKTDDTTTLANESMFVGVSEFQSLMQNLLSQKTAIHPFGKAAEGSIAIPPKEACETPEQAPTFVRSVRATPPGDALNAKPLSEQKIPLSLPGLLP